jgi:hypothetical protein
MTKYIYTNTNPNLISFSTLILGTKFPQPLFRIDAVLRELIILDEYSTRLKHKANIFLQNIYFV